MNKFDLSNVFLIFSRDFKEYRKRRVLWIFLLFFLIGAVGCGRGMISAASGIHDTSAEGRELWLMILGNVLVLFPMVPQFISIPLFSTTPLTYEKANGVVMSLLATELKPAEIWMGKSLAIFLPGMIAGYTSFWILLVCFESIIAIPIPVMVCAGLLMPMSMWLLSIITIQVSMVKSVEKAIAPSYILGFLLLALFPAGSITGVYIPGKIAFTIVCLLVLGLFLVTERILASKMTVESIILARVK